LIHNYAYSKKAKVTLGTNMTIIIIIIIIIIITRSSPVVFRKMHCTDLRKLQVCLRIHG
jgi:hypothetical protein